MDPKVKPNLVVDEIEDETLVYDLDRHRAHCLNATAGFLLRSADGTRSVAELASLAELEFGATGAEGVVRFGLERLRKAGLLEWSEPPRTGGGVSRREMLLKVAAVGLVIPAVVTLVSPTPAQATTYISKRACNLANVGKCCKKGKKGKLCIKNKKGKYRCTGAPC